MGVHTWFYRRANLKGDDKPKQLNKLNRTINGVRYIEDAKRSKPLITIFGKEVKYYHDLFRVEKDTNITLHSEEETVKFIKDNRIYDVQWEDLEKFWKKYPDGMICFG
jgi:hypothetical protein